MVRLCLLLSFLVTYVSAQGQKATRSSGWAYERPVFLSPETASFLRYDNLPVALNTGRLDLNIPAVRLDDPDFDFPVTLSYDSGGYRPAEPEGMVGLNWSLLFGGVIYREVRGIPDNIANVSRYIEPSCQESYKGFMNTKTMGLDSGFKRLAFENPDEYLKFYRGSLGTVGFRRILDSQIEASSDIYTFNFCGHSGQFLVDFNGEAVVTGYSGKGKVKVDLSGYGLSDTGREALAIALTTDDGYTYTFGGTMHAVEYTALSWPDYAVNARNPEFTTVHAFYLTGIRASNGRELTVGYLQNVTDRQHREPRTLMDEPVTEKVLQNYTLLGRAYSTWIGEKDCNHMFSLNKTAVVTGISTDREHIRFFYSSPEKGAFSTVDGQQISHFGYRCGVQLDSIHRYSLVGTPALIERCGFEYGFQDRRFLKKVSHSVLGTYRFSYNKTVPDSPLTVAVDHWGFWNGRYGSIMPVMRDEYGNLYMSDERDPGGECDVALLSSVIYPTGGCVEFEYEPNLLSDGKKERLAGGARVRSIVSRTDPHTVRRCFSYDRADTGLSSGELEAEYPVYKIHDYLRETFFIDDSGNLIPDAVLPADGPFVDSNGFNPGNGYPFHLSYREVTEYTDPDVDIPEPENPYVESLCITHLEEAGSKVFTTQVHDDSTVWELSFANSRNARGKALVYKGQYNQVGGYVSADPQKHFTVNPYKEWGAGSYFLVLIGGEGASVTVEVIKDTASPWIHKPVYRGAHVTTRFTGGGGIGGISHTKLVGFPLESQTGNLVQTKPMPLESWSVKQHRHVYPHTGGKIQQRQHFGSDGKLFLEETVGYDRSGNAEEHYALDVYTPHHEQYGGLYYGWSSVTQLTRFLLFRHNPASRIVRQYTPGGEILSETCWQYDHEGYYLLAENERGKEANRRTDYLYAYQADGEPYRSMRSLHVLSPLVRKTVWLDGKVQSDERWEYLLPGDTVPVPDFKKPMVRRWETSVGGHPSSIRLENHRFDAYGNVLHLTEDGVRDIVYIWCYEGLYPIARIENATLDEVEAALGMTVASVSGMEDTTRIDGALAGLRGRLPDASVTTYTYAPFVGMTGRTDPTGQTRYYEYDAEGRLTEVYRMRKNGKEVIQHQRYHIVHP